MGIFSARCDGRLASAGDGHNRTVPSRASKRFDTLSDRLQIVAVFFRAFRQPPISQQKAFLSRDNHDLETDVASTFGIFTLPNDMNDVHASNFAFGLFDRVGVQCDSCFDEIVKLFRHRA
jgi:hypothetical protein